MTLIPETVSAIKADWLSKVLSERFPGVAVADIEIAHSREGTNQHGYIRVNYQNPAGGPEQLFCKMLPSDSARKKLIANTHMGLREALFYKSVAPYLNMRTPEIYYADCNEQDDSFILLMEDIEASGCTVSDGTQTVAIDSAAQALEDLANIHLQFEVV